MTTNIMCFGDNLNSNQTIILDRLLTFRSVTYTQINPIHLIHIFDIGQHGGGSGL